MGKPEGGASAGTTTVDGDGASGVDAPPPTASLRRYTARLVLAGLALGAALAAVVGGRDWLGGQRVGTVVVLSLAVAWLLVRDDRGWPVGVAAVLALGVAWQTTTELGRQDGGFARRVLGDDLPPAAVYAAAALTVVVLVGAVVLVVTGRGRADHPALTGPPRRRAQAVAGVALVLVLAAATVGGIGARVVADDLADDDAVHHAVRRSAEETGEMADPTGPEEADDQVWKFDLAGDLDLDPQEPVSASSAAVPGWDVVLGSIEVPSAGRQRLVAVSATDGEELWRYERPGSFTTTVDPATGRVLLLGGNAAVVLGLTDGAELSTRRLDDEADCSTNLLHPRGLFGWSGMGVGDTAVVGCGGVHTVRVADGEPLAVTRGLFPASGCNAAAAEREAPLLLRWGIHCGPPTLLGLEPDGSLAPVAEIAPPEDASGGCALCDFAVAADDDLVAVSIAWPEPGSEEDHEVAGREIVALTADGDERWRVEVDDRTRPVGVTAAGVVIKDDTAWHLLSRDDGRELAQAPALPEEADATTVTDGERIYSAGGTVTTRRVDDLRLVGTHPGKGRALDGRLQAHGGLLIYRHGLTELVAIGDPAA